MNDRHIQGLPMQAACPRLLDLAHQIIRWRHRCYRTEQAYSLIDHSSQTRKLLDSHYAGHESILTGFGTIREGR
jgi:hypothetical protein